MGLSPMSTKVKVFYFFTFFRSFFQCEKGTGDPAGCLPHQPADPKKFRSQVLKVPAMMSLPYRGVTWLSYHGMRRLVGPPAAGGQWAARIDGSRSKPATAVPAG